MFITVSIYFTLRIAFLKILNVKDAKKLLQEITLAVFC